MIRPTILRILVWLIFLDLPLVAQENKQFVQLLPLVHSEGLSSTRVTSIVQDKQGYIWFGTEEGLNRYNGQAIKVFRNSPRDSTSLSSNSISRMLVDRRGFLWIGTTGGGLNRYNPTTGTFTVYRYEAHNPRSLPSDNVQFLLESRKGEIWIGADNGGGLARFDPDKEEFTRYLPVRDTVDPDEKNNISVLCLLEDHQDSTLWVGTRDGLYHFNPKSNSGKKSFEVYRDKPESKFGEPENLIMTLYQDSSDILWIGHWGGGLKSFNKNKRTDPFKTYRYTPLQPSDGNYNYNIVLSVLSKSESELWVSTHDSGLAVFDKLTEKFDFIQEDPTNPLNRYPTQTSFLYQDQTGILWVGSFDGVRYINPYAKSFRVIPLPSASKGDIPKAVVSFYSLGKRLHVGALTGTNLFEYSTSKATWRTYPLTTLPQNTRGMLRDRSERFWISTTEGLFQLDTTTARFTPVFPLPNSPPSFKKIHFTGELLEDRRGDVWVGTQESGLFKIGKRNGKQATLTYDYFLPNKDDLNSIVGDAISALLEDQKGNIWIATASGLSCYDPLSRRFTNYTHEPKKLNGLPVPRLTGLAEDQTGNIWIGTLGGGLCRLTGVKTNNPSFTIFTVENGLPSNRIFRLITDQRGRIWMGTARGLSCLDPERNQIHNFDKRDGLVQDQLNNELAVSETGHIFIDFPGRITAFHPDSLLARQPTVPLAIYSFKVFDKEASLDSAIEFKRRVQVDYDENFFTLSFALLNYVNPERNQYRYKLEAYDEQWNQAGNLGYATYKKVPPGQYVFRVQAANNNGEWIQSAAPLTIMILPPPWQTGWAYTGYGLLAGIVLLLARREVIKRERLRANLLIKQVESDKWQELDAMKSRFFANISHEFRTPLTVILGTTDELLEHEKKGAGFKQQYTIIQRNAQRLLQLINQLLDLSRLEAGRLKLDLRSNNLTDSLHTIVQSFSSLAERRGIRYLVQLPEQDYWALFDRDQLEKIYSNLLSNALKFTSTGGAVTVTTTVESVANPPAYRLAVTVADTGIGIAREQLPHIFDRFYQGDNSTTRAYEGSGIGLALAKELTELHGGEITVESTPGEGTVFKVVLTLPLAQGDEEAATIPLVTSMRPVDEPGANSTAVAETSRKNQVTEDEAYQTKVLVVEDDADLRRYICKHFSSQYVVLEAENGAVGWGVALEALPDLVVSDVMMPEIDGLTLCERLKQHATTAHIPVVLLTARVEREDKIGGLLIGADDYLTKPFHVQELMVRAHNLIEARKKLRELFHREMLLHPEETKVPSADDLFLKGVIDVIHQNMDNDQFGLEELCRKVGLSRTQLYRKLFALTSQAPSDFIRTIRLRRAASLLSQRAGNVAEIAYRVGFRDASTFSKAFTKEFGCPPSDYAQKQVQ